MTEYVIKDNATIWRRDIGEVELEIQPAALEALGASFVRKTPQIFLLKEWGPVGIALSNDPNTAFFTTKLKRIPLRAPFKIVAKKEEQWLVPTFNDPAAQLMPLEWQPPEGMFLNFLQMCTVNPGNRERERWYSNKAWLFATDASGKTYKLPLPNVYDDCSICEGEWPRYAKTGEECVQAALGQFEKSEWNSDLWRNPEATQKMFRFRAKKDGFECIPPDVSWPSLCVKVSVDISKNIV